MKLSRLIALRYLHSSRENRYFSWITVLSVMGLAIGVSALIVVISVFNGFEIEVRKRLLQSNAHIWATSYPYGLEDPPKWERVIMANPDFGPKIQAIAPFIHSQTMAKNDAALRGVFIRGVIPRQQEKVQSLINLVQPPQALQILQHEIDDHAKGLPIPEVPSVILGVGLQNTLNTKVGEVVRLIDPSASTFVVSKPFKVVGTFNSGLQDADNRIVVMSLSTAQNLTGLGDKVTGLSFALKNPELSAEISALMSRSYDNLTFKNWESFNSRFFETMASERVRVGLIVGLVALVAGFNILTTVFVSVSQRQKDISILKALGASTSSIMQIFLLQSTAIGLLGSLIGVILAGIISYILENFPFLDLPDPYLLRTLPVAYSFTVYAGACLIASGICWFAGLYPAYIASRVNPSEGMAGTGQAL